MNIKYHTKTLVFVVIIFLSVGCSNEVIVDSFEQD